MNNKSIKITALLACMGGFLLLNSPTASAGTCTNYIAKANAVFGSLISDACAGVNTEASLDNNPFVYTNKDGGCPSGLQLPGLPDFGSITGGINACAIMKAVTSDMVSKVNSTIRTTMNDTVSGINAASQSAVGGNAIGGNTNVNSIVEQKVREAAAAAEGK
jgi:hypothetical protein